MANTGIFIRDVQITGDMTATGRCTSQAWMKTVVAFHTTTPTSFSGQPTAAPPGPTPIQAPPSLAPASACSAIPYFTCMFPDNGGYWRHMGWGEPAAFNGVVHLVYSHMAWH